MSERPVRAGDPPVPTLVEPDIASLPGWALPPALRDAERGHVLVVDRAAVTDFAAAALRGVGARPADARLTAQTLVLADGRGHPSHGISRLPQYLRLCDSGSTDPAARHTVLVRRPSLEAWDARRALGPAVGHRAMRRAIARARVTGLAAVVVRQASHYGVAGAYVLRAMEAGLIGISSCNAEPRVPPTGAAAPGLGTNPIAIGAPDGDGRGFLLDMATSVVALGKIEIRARAGHDIPAGWALDLEGRPTTDPSTALAGMVLPLGGESETSGYKGYGLAAAVELLTGLLGGGRFGLHTTGLWDTTAPAGTSQLHLALDPELFGAGAFGARLREWRDELTSLPRRPGVDEIVLAGELEWRADERQAERVEVLPATLLELAGIAAARGLRRPWLRVVAGLGS